MENVQQFFTKLLQRLQQPFEIEIDKCS